MEAERRVRAATPATPEGAGEEGEEGKEGGGDTKKPGETEGLPVTQIQDFRLTR